MENEIQSLRANFSEQIRQLRLEDVGVVNIESGIENGKFLYVELRLEEKHTDLRGKVLDKELFAVSDEITAPHEIEKVMNEASKLETYSSHGKKESYFLVDTKAIVKVVENEKGRKAELYRGYRKNRNPLHAWDNVPNVIEAPFPKELHGISKLSSTGDYFTGMKNTIADYQQEIRCLERLKTGGSQADLKEFGREHWNAKPENHIKYIEEDITRLASHAVGFGLGALDFGDLESAKQAYAIVAEHFGCGKK